MFFNSNQATTVISGGGEKNLLLIKDSFANTFAQFVINEYSTTHMIDLRFYRGSITGYISKNNIDEVVVLYSVPSFAEDEYIQYCMEQSAADNKITVLICSCPLRVCGDCEFLEN